MAGSGRLLKSVMPLAVMVMASALVACGDTAPKWEPQSMFGTPAAPGIDDQYLAMADFKAMARDEAGKMYPAGPNATVLGAVEEAVVLCQNGGGTGCKAVRVGLTYLEGLDRTAIDVAISSYRDTLTAEAYQAARAGNAGAANWLAYHYATRNENLGEAERLIRAAMAQQPDNPNILDTYGLILFRKGDYAEAEEVFVAVNRVSPSAEHIAHFADNALAMGKTDMARAAFLRALDAGPGPILQQQIQQRLLSIDLGKDNTTP
ncbi:MAG: hypothetical protein ABID63_16795 [Pseudomonadota bacterium]